MSLQTQRSLIYRSAPPATPARRLLILLHGVGGNETNLEAFIEQVPDDTQVVLARAPLAMGPTQHAWFAVSFGPQGPQPDLVAAESSRRRLVTFVGEMQVDTGIGPERTVVAGFSQGGIMCASLALTRPDLVAGFGVLAGRILPELEPQLATPDALRRLHAFIGHGRDDSKLTVDWAHRADAWLSRLGIAHEARLYPGDHGLPVEMQRDFLSWFDRTTATALTTP